MTRDTSGGSFALKDSTLRDVAPRLPIIVVEDNEADYQMLVDLLTRTRSVAPIAFRVPLESGIVDAALALGARVCFLAVDYQDQEADVARLQAVIKQFESRNLSIPVILLAKWRGKDGGVAALQAGAADFLIKSALRPTVLERSIRFTLERERQRQEALALMRESQSVDVPADVELVDLFKLQASLQEVRSCLDEIDDQEDPSVRRAQELLKDSLSLFDTISVDEHSASRKPFSEFDFRYTVRETLALLRSIFRDSIEVEFDFPEKEMPVDGDAMELQEAIIQLALNAQDAMPDGGVLNVKLKLARSYPGAALGTCVELHIMDSGVGIELDDMSRLFDPSFTTNPITRDFGLGLATVKRTIDRHGGTISIESDPGEWTRVVIKLPTSGSAPLRDTNRHKPEAANAVGLFSGDPEVQTMVSAYASAAGFDLIYLDSLEQLEMLVTYASRLPAGLIVDADQLSQRSCDLVTELTQKHGVTVFCIADQLQIDRPDSLYKELIELSNVSVYKKPGQLILLATSLSQLAVPGDA